MPIIQGKVLEGSVIYTDWKAYDGLILNGYDHYRVHHSNNEFARGKCHVNGIEFLQRAAQNLMVFLLYLKECEFRFNYRGAHFYDKILEVIGSKN